MTFFCCCTKKMTPINKKRKLDFEQSEFEHAPLPRHYNLKIEKSNLYQRRKINKNAQKIRPRKNDHKRTKHLSKENFV